MDDCFINVKIVTESNTSHQAWVVSKPDSHAETPRRGVNLQWFLRASAALREVDGNAGVGRILASLWDATFVQGVSGGVAALNHRLMAATPPAWSVLLLAAPLLVNSDN